MSDPADPAPRRSGFLRSPILHFLVAGALLFAGAVFVARDRGEGADVAARAATDSPTASTIRVEREALVAFVQSRTRLATPAEAEQVLASGEGAVRRDWIARYVREEALVREARALGLDRDDELIRRRLVQQMEFLAESVDEDAIRVDDAEVAAAYAARIADDRHPATFRFAHVFIRELEGFESKAPERAKVILSEMNQKRIAFEEGYPYGDRFLYDRTYVDRNLDEIRSHFGDAFAKTLSKLEPTPGRWTGPYRSEHGLHLVMLAASTPARDASLEEVAGELREELLREKREQAMERATAAIVDRYRVDLAEGLGDDAGSPQR